jgi:hypothetical protein
MDRWRERRRAARALVTCAFLRTWRSGGYLRFQAQYLRRIRLPTPECIAGPLCTKIKKAFSARDFVALEGSGRHEPTSLRARRNTRVRFRGYEGEVAPCFGKAGMRPSDHVGGRVYWPTLFVLGCAWADRLLEKHPREFCGY